ncbi:hypothetical protein OFC56_33685, partial [Escherichia coli]|nr:hypothetical protein [Escherichia coli]
TSDKSTCLSDPVCQFLPPKITTHMCGLAKSNLILRVLHELRNYSDAKRYYEAKEKNHQLACFNYGLWF